MARSLPRGVALGLLLVAAGALAAIFWRQSTVPPEPGRLQLSLERGDSAFRLRWNPAAIGKSNLGLLTIRDGEGERTRLLNRGELQAGVYAYPARTGDVRFDLEIYEAQGRRVESVRALGQTPLLQQSAEQIPAAVASDRRTGAPRTAAPQTATRRSPAPRRKEAAEGSDDDLRPSSKLHFRVADPQADRAEPEAVESQAEAAPVHAAAPARREPAQAAEPAPPPADAPPAAAPRKPEEPERKPGLLRRMIRRIPVVGK